MNWKVSVKQWVRFNRYCMWRKKHGMRELTVREEEVIILKFA